MPFRSSLKYELKERLLEGLQEFDTELEVAAQEIAKQALQHIPAYEVILTLGQSRTVEQFFKCTAEKGLKFQVNAIFGLDISACRLRQFEGYQHH